MFLAEITQPPSSSSVYPGVYSWRVLKASPHSIYSNYWDHIWFFSLQTLSTLATVELHTALAFGKHMASEENFL